MADRHIRTYSFLIRFIINATCIIKTRHQLATAGVAVVQNKSLEHLSSLSDWFRLQSYHCI